MVTDVVGEELLSEKIKSKWKKLNVVIDSFEQLVDL